MHSIAYFLFLLAQNEAEPNNDGGLTPILKSVETLVPIILSFPFFFFLGIIMTGWFWGYTLAISNAENPMEKDFSGFGIPGHLFISIRGRQVKIGLAIFVLFWFFVGIFHSDFAWQVIVLNMGFPENRLIATTGLAAFLSLSCSSVIAVGRSLIAFVSTRIQFFREQRRKPTPEQIIETITREEPVIVDTAVD